MKTFIFNLGCCTALMGAVNSAQAAEQVSVSQTSIQAHGGEVGLIESKNYLLSPSEATTARMWGLSTEEMVRVSQLMKGPRGSFSVSNLSPLEVLGIHARTDAERQKYAQLFAKVFVDDVRRSVEWSKVSQLEINRIVGDSPVVSFEGQSAPQANRAMAAGANVPRSVLAAPKAGAASNGPASKSVQRLEPK
jgi:hypothetical protein